MLFRSNNTNNRQGIYVVNGTTQISSGTLNIAGSLYSSGTIQDNTATSVSVTGALVTPSSLQASSATTLNVTYNAPLATSVLGSGSVYTLQIQHWEDEY